MFLHDFPIQQFEDFVSDRILKKGREYWQAGYVLRLDRINNDYSYMASVADRDKDIYSVEIELSGPESDITDVYCNCPFNQDIICKHVVATLFGLRDQLAQERSASKPLTSTLQTPTPADQAQLDTVLGKLNFEEMKSFIRNGAMHNPDMLNQFLLAFAEYADKTGKAFYLDRIYSGLFVDEIDLSQAEALLEKTSDNVVNYLMAESIRCLGAENYRKAVDVCAALLDFFVQCNAQPVKKDFYRYTKPMFQEYLELNIKLLTSITDRLREVQRLPEFKEQLFNELHEGVEKLSVAEHHSSVPMTLKLLKELIALVETEEEAEKVFKLHRRVASLIAGHSDEYFYWLLCLLAPKIGNSDRVTSVLLKNSSNPDVRMSYVRDLIKGGAYDVAKKLCENAISKNMRTDGFAPRYKWREFLLEIAEYQGDKMHQAEYSRWLFIHDAGDEKNGKAYFNKLKAAMSKKEWAETLPGLIKELKNSRYEHFTRPYVYAREHMHEELLDWLTFQPTLNLELVKKYERYLKKNHGAQLLEIYAELIQDLVEKSKSRPAYAEACSYLSRMRKISPNGNKRAEELSQALRKTYSRRRALKQELEAEARKNKRKS